LDYLFDSIVRLVHIRIGYEDGRLILIEEVLDGLLTFTRPVPSVEVPFKWWKLCSTSFSMPLQPYGMVLSHVFLGINYIALLPDELGALLGLEDEVRPAAPLRRVPCLSC